DTESLIRSIKSAVAGGLSLEDQVAAKVVPRLLRQQEDELGPDPSLTPRERAILKAIGEGRSNSEIAELLHLSVGTVKNHISHLLDKLELRDRTQLAIYAICRHLV